MKEFVAETGGRYTYADDILNLQELALSMTAIFTGCSNFIISGCEVSGSEIAPGYVWINGRVRYFSGCKNATWPYYIYEQNKNETVTYANDVSKKGRSLYLSAGSNAVPEVADPITGHLPQFIEMTSGYTPRFIDKFFGRYAVLADSPFARQTVKKDLILTGNFSADKNIENKTAVSVVNAESGYSLRNIVKANGDAAVGAYLNGLLVNEIVIGTVIGLRAPLGHEAFVVRSMGISLALSSLSCPFLLSVFIFDLFFTFPIPSFSFYGIWNRLPFLPFFFLHRKGCLFSSLPPYDAFPTRMG